MSGACLRICTAASCRSRGSTRQAAEKTESQGTASKWASFFMNVPREATK